EDGRGSGRRLVVEDDRVELGAALLRNREEDRLRAHQEMSVPFGEEIAPPANAPGVGGGATQIPEDGRERDGLEVIGVTMITHAHEELVCRNVAGSIGEV